MCCCCAVLYVFVCDVMLNMFACFVRDLLCEDVCRVMFCVCVVWLFNVFVRCVCDLRCDVVCSVGVLCVPVGC